MSTSNPLISDLINDWTAAPPSPRLTWYGSDGERIELTSKVLVNWVIKAANLLVDEADIGPGEAVELALPAHWRALVWALATWRVGGQVITEKNPENISARIVLDSEPNPADVTIVVPLAALARQIDNPVSGVIDGAAELMSQADVLIFDPGTEADSPAWGELRHADLLAGVASGGSADSGTGVGKDDGAGHSAGHDADADAGSSAAATEGGRYLVQATSLDSFLTDALRIYAVGGSIVAVAPDAADGSTESGRERLTAIADQEGAVALG